MILFLCLLLNFSLIEKIYQTLETVFCHISKGTVRVKCLAQEHNIMTWPGLEPGPFDPESRVLTIAPLGHCVSQK